MDEDRFNMSIRKYLKMVGVTSQREIEAATRQAGPKPGAKLKAKMVLTMPEIGLKHEIDGEIET
ncbi:MAG TPA: DUF6494 family protein [Stellaceae bacterium]|jgi:Family of unknown function (DUF6494)|nr:DUF6494 family protein [Stellaceae bacterium]